MSEELQVAEQPVEAPNAAQPQIEEPKKKKKGKGLIIGLIITLVALAAIYFVGGTAAGYYGIGYFMKQRNSSESDLTTFYNKIFYVRKDYSNLNVREEITFKVSNTDVKGYLYECPSPKGIVVASHDIINQSDSNISQVYNYFYEHGYDVFAFDHIGCGRSGGEGLISMYQSKYTVLEAIKTVKSIDRLANLDVMLFGHSFGGYGVTAASNDESVKAVAAIGTYNNARDALYQYAVNNISEWLKLLTPDYDLALKFTSQEYFHNCADDISKNHNNKKFLIAQGKKDNFIIANTSLYSAVKGKKLSNVTCVELEDMKHENLWNTADAASYIEEILKNYKEVKAQYKGNIPEDVYNELLAQVDKDRSSALNTSLLQQIVDMYDSAVSN